MKSQGTIIKIPDVSPGVLFVDGEQRKFAVEGIWLSPVAPALNQTVEIESDASGAISSLRVIAPKVEASGASAPPTSTPAPAASAVTAPPVPLVPVPVEPTPVVAPAPAASADDSDTKQASAVADKGLREHSHAGRTLAILGGLALIVTVAIVTLGIVAKGHSATAERSGDENARAWPSAPLRSPTPPHAPAGASAEHALTPAAAGRQEEEKGEDENAPDQEVVTRVRRVLDSKAVGSFILSGYLHWGAPYNGHQFVQQAAVTFGGKVAPKRFGLVYRFRWDNDGLTDVAFLCDESGLIYAVQVLKTNAGMSKPFFAADAALAVGSFGIAAALDDRLTPEQKQSLIDTARQPDAKASLESALGLLTSLQ